MPRKPLAGNSTDQPEHHAADKGQHESVIQSALDRVKQALYKAPNFSYGLYENVLAKSIQGKMSSHRHCSTLLYLPTVAICQIFGQGLLPISCSHEAWTDGTLYTRFCA